MKFLKLYEVFDFGDEDWDFEEEPEKQKKTLGNFSVGDKLKIFDFRLWSSNFSNNCPFYLEPKPIICELIDIAYKDDYLTGLILYNGKKYGVSLDEGDLEYEKIN